MKNTKTCHHCEGKGFIELRDCSGEIQREEICSFCEGMEQLLNLLRLKKDDNNIRPIEKILIAIAHDFDFNQFTVEN